MEKIVTLTQARTTTRKQNPHTYVWMILWQNTEPEFKRLLLQKQRILVPTKSIVSGSKVTNCGA